MAQIKLRLNLSTEEVELLVDDKVTLSTGPEVFKNWVDAYNEKHKPVAAPVEEKTVEVVPEPTVDNDKEE